MPLGELLDQWEIHKQFEGLAKPKRELFIDEIIPVDLWFTTFYYFFLKNNWQLYIIYWNYGVIGYYIIIAKAKII